MSQIFVADRVEKPKNDLVLGGVLLLLAGVGLAILFSASYFRATSLDKDPWYFFINQLIYALAGFLGAFLISRMNLDRLKAVVPWLVLISLVLMLITFIQGVGASFLGARRWIVVFGMSFQPSELVKLTLVLYLATILAKKEAQLDKPKLALLPPFIVVSVFVVLIYLQNNFSTALFLLSVGIAIFFMAGVKLRYFVLLGLIVLPLVIMGVLARGHGMERLAVFVEPDREPSGSGYQVLSSQSALREGGFWGQGIGQGERKLGKLPEAQSDFIFAVVGEELGYLGVIGVLGLFGFFAWRGYSLAFRAPDLFRRLIAFGVTTSIVFQALINIPVTAGVFPPTGIPLPFFSAGGSSLLLTLCMCGLLLNVARTTEKSEGVRHG
jgi:cell division protein FtsW